MPIRRILLILLAVAVIAPVGLFIRHEWNESQVCKREFGCEAETSDYEICTEYGANPELCGDPALQPFRCTEDFIAGR